MENIPNRIYLQVDPENENPETFDEMVSGEITWYRDKINDNDIPYYRHKNSNPLVMQKIAETSEPIMNITKFRYDNVMNILDSVKNAEIKVPIDLFLKLDQSSKEKILSDIIKQMQKSVAFAMETLSSFAA